MRVLLISTLAATLTGCACFTPPLPVASGCTTMTGYACSSLTGTEPESKPVAFKIDAENEKPISAARTQKAPSPLFGKKTNPASKRVRYATSVKMRPLPSVQLNDKADPVIEKVKTAVAGMMENPATAQFGEMKRVVRTLLGETIDAVCGYLKVNNGSGEDAGQLRFVYVIQHNEAYIVDGSSTMAATAYRDLCN